MRDIKELNISGNYEAAPTDQQLELVEKLIGAKLPESYRNFLHRVNGGKPQLNSFLSEFEGNEQRWTMDRFLHLAATAAATNDSEDVVWAYQQQNNKTARELLPVILDNEGNYYCLDLGQEFYGRLVLLSRQEPEFSFLPIADSFEQFVDGLTANPLDA